MAAGTQAQPFEFYPVMPERWPDLEELFGPRGAYSGCWCMWWRLSRKDFNAQTGAQHREGLKTLVESGQVPGILAYAGGTPVAWCSIACRETHVGLERSRTLARVDDAPVWSITCFYVTKPYRRQGLMAELIEAAVKFAGERGARIVEAYPTESDGREPSGSAGYMGSTATFARAGFVEVARRPYGRLIVRYFLDRTL